MMIPRGYAASPFGVSPPKYYDEKQLHLRDKRRKSSSTLRQHISLSQSAPRVRNASPVSSQRQQKTYDEPPKPTLQVSSPPAPIPTIIEPIMATGPQPGSLRRESAQSAKQVLASTAIPIRRKPRQRASQRIPTGDHVAEFSKLLLDDVKPARKGGLPSSLGISQFDGLFGNIDGLMEGEMIVGSEGLSASILSTRSFSTESMPSLASPEDFSATDKASLSPPMIRSVSDRRIKQLATSEDCIYEHPLGEESNDEGGEGATTPDLSISASPRKAILKERKPLSFKSSLTASLRAIKNAAQSVSNYVPISVQPDDFGGNHFFDFQPSLTDDRRPPPSSPPPSPALRRYLNPNMSPESPAQLHFWIDDRPGTVASSPDLRSMEFDVTRTKQKRKKQSGTAQKGAPIVQLSTCIPSQIRTAHASSPPIWIAPDGTPSNKQTAAAMWDGTEAGLKQCEPRENSDFLRIFVCEMRMRKAKKLRDDVEGRAKMWLPPIEREKRSLRPADERLWASTPEP